MSNAVTSSRMMPLEPGDSLTREEFHRRYLGHPDIKAELIDGVVYMPSPARKKHGNYQAIVVFWLMSYATRDDKLDVSTEVTLRLQGNNEPKPDAVLRLTQNGTSTVDDEGYIEGPPEFVAEVAMSSASYDLHQKRAMYEQVGVSEYLVLDVAGQCVHWWALVDGRYEPLPEVDGFIESQVFDGLRLDVAALLAMDVSSLA